MKRLLVVLFLVTAAAVTQVHAAPCGCGAPSSGRQSVERRQDDLTLVLDVIKHHGRVVGMSQWFHERSEAHRVCGRGQLAVHYLLFRAQLRGLTDLAWRIKLGQFYHSCEISTAAGLSKPTAGYAQAELRVFEAALKEVASPDEAARLRQELHRAMYNPTPLCKASPWPGPQLAALYEAENRLMLAAAMAKVVSESCPDLRQSPVFKDYAEWLRLATCWVHYWICEARGDFGPVDFSSQSWQERLQAANDFGLWARGLNQLWQLEVHPDFVTAVKTLWPEQARLLQGRPLVPASGQAEAVRDALAARVNARAFAYFRHVGLPALLKDAEARERWRTAPITDHVILWLLFSEIPEQVFQGPLSPAEAKKLGADELKKRAAAEAQKLAADIAATTFTQEEVDALVAERDIMTPGSCCPVYKDSKCAQEPPKCRQFWSPCAPCRRPPARVCN